MVQSVVICLSNSPMLSPAYLAQSARLMLTSASTVLRPQSLRLLVMEDRLHAYER